MDYTLWNFLKYLWKGGRIMNIWFIILAVLGAIAVLVNLAFHGRPKEDVKYNFFTALIAVAIELILVYNAIVAGF